MEFNVIACIDSKLGLGKNNKIIVKNNFIIKGKVLFAPGAQLVIEFDANGQDPFKWEGSVRIGLSVASSSDGDAPL